jgi:hypothetical protein
VLRVIAISALLTWAAPAVTRGASWHRPVSGRIVGTFSFAPAAPYVAGQRRGIAIAAPPGMPVRAACGGRVVFAGAVGRAGPTVSVGCGPLRATYQGIAALTVDEGDVVAPDAPIAKVGAHGVLRLGAREGPGRYVDPATLFADREPPLGPAPPPARRRWRPRTPSPPLGDRLTIPTARPVAGPAAVPVAAPAAAWLGLGVLAAALPVGGLAQSTRRRRAKRHAVAGAISAPVRS